jgi:cytochrome P450
MREPISEPAGTSLGELFDPLGAHLADPYPFYARSRREEPIFYSGVLDAWLVSRFADVRAVMRDGEAYSSANTLRPLVELSPAAFGVLAQGYPPIKSFIEQDGEPHLRWRVPTADRFSPWEVDTVEPFIRDRANALVDAFVDDGQADFMAQYANLLPVDVICRMLGIDKADTEILRRGSFALGALVNERLSEAEQVKAAEDGVAFQHLIARNVRARRAEPGGDVISRVVAALAPGDGPLTFEQEYDLVPNLLGVGVAGNITTTGLLGNAVRWLLEHPAQWRLLCERPELIPGAVEEAGRFDPPTHGFFRVTTKDVTLAGKDLPAGTEVFALFASANRDETVFERPDEFDITRPGLGRAMTFGHGAHFCLGSGLARREAAVTLEVLTARLPGLRLVPGQRYDFRPNIDHRGLLSLLFEW